MIQEFIDIDRIDLLNKTLDMKNAGYRFAQACALKSGGIFLLYSFIKDNKLTTLRFKAEPDEKVESIGWLYSYAFIYENEIKDLYGIDIVNMNMDFNGHFYDLSVKTPFNPVESDVKNDG